MMSFEYSESCLYLTNAYITGSWTDIVDVHRSVHSKTDRDASPHDLRFVDLLYSLLPASLLGKEWCPPAFLESSSDCEVEFRHCAAQLHSALLALSSKSLKESERHIDLFCLYFADFLAKYFPSSGSSLLFRRFDASPCLCDCLKKFYLTSKLSASGLLPTRMTVVLGMHRSGTSALSGMLAQASPAVITQQIAVFFGPLIAWWIDAPSEYADPVVHLISARPAVMSDP